MKPYHNYTCKQLIDIIATGNISDDLKITDVCDMAFKKITIEQEGVKLVRVLRKDKLYDLAHIYHEKLKNKFPNSNTLKNEALWLKFSSEVCNKDNSEFEVDADFILKNSSQEDPASKLVYEVTALVVISILISQQEYSQAYKWTTRLNPTKLGDKGRQGNNELFYPSNKQQYYTYKATILIETNKIKYYINWVYEHLKFSDEKRIEFVEYIIKIITYTRDDHSTYISKNKLSNILYLLDLDLISKASYLAKTVNQPNALLLSELSQYIYCPVSFSINKTYNIPTLKPMDSSVIWMGNKDGFYDRYLKYQKNKDILAAFKNHEVVDSVELTARDIQIFENLFKGKLIINNYFDTTNRSFNSDNKKLRGAPDYVVQLNDGKRVLIQEKFSSVSSANASKVYNSDIIETEAYLTKFKNLNVDYAYFINWIWSIYKLDDDVGFQGAMIRYVKKVDIHLIKIKDAREQFVEKESEKINSLKSGNHLNVKNVSFPSRCLNCSVYIYCEHKSGTKNTLRFPYND